jgi:hypothetical protein
MLIKRAGSDYVFWLTMHDTRYVADQISGLGWTLVCDVGGILLLVPLLICNISLLVGGERSDRDLHSHPTSRVVGTIRTTALGL